MKKLLLTLTAVTALAFASQAQTEQGKVIVGGGIGFSSNEVKDSGSKTTSFNIQPNVGYFVSDNIAIGAGIGYNWSKNENENLVFRFLKDYNNFRKEYEHTFMPHIDGTDGFYCALLIKE